MAIERTKALAKVLKDASGPAADRILPFSGGHNPPFDRCRAF